MDTQDRSKLARGLHFSPLVAEKGDFLALDLGGTNFRVLHVRVMEEEKKVLKMDSQVCAIPQEMMLGPGEQVGNLSSQSWPPIKRRHRKCLERPRILQNLSKVILDMVTVVFCTPLWCIFQMIHSTVS